MAEKVNRKEKFGDKYQIPLTEKHAHPRVKARQIGRRHLSRLYDSGGISAKE